MPEDAVTCLSCHCQVQADEHGAMPALCPHCGQMLVLDDEPAEPAPAIAPEDELEEVKIRRVVRDRRAMVRTRGYYLALMVGLWVAGAQAIWNACTLVRSSVWSLMMIAYVIIGAGCVLLGWEMRRRASAIAKTITTSELPEPQKPPDFTGLSDGSQHARNLEDTK